MQTAPVNLIRGGQNLAPPRSSTPQMFMYNEATRSPWDSNTQRKAPINPHSQPLRRPLLSPGKQPLPGKRPLPTLASLCFCLLSFSLTCYMAHTGLKSKGFQTVDEGRSCRCQGRCKLPPPPFATPSLVGWITRTRTHACREIPIDER